MKGARGDFKQAAAQLDTPSYRIRERLRHILQKAVLRNDRRLMRLIFDWLLPRYTNEFIAALEESRGNRSSVAHKLDKREPQITRMVRTISKVAAGLGDQRTLRRLHCALNPIPNNYAQVLRAGEEEGWALHKVARRLRMGWWPFWRMLSWMGMGALIRRRTDILRRLPSDYRPQSLPAGLSASGEAETVSNPKRTVGQRHFTFLEFLVTMGIVSVLFAIGFEIYHSWFQISAWLHSFFASGASGAGLACAMAAPISRRDVQGSPEVIVANVGDFKEQDAYLWLQQRLKGLGLDIRLLEFKVVFDDQSDADRAMVYQAIEGWAGRYRREKNEVLDFYLTGGQSNECLYGLFRCAAARVCTQHVPARFIIIEEVVTGKKLWSDFSDYLVSLYTNFELITEGGVRRTLFSPGSPVLLQLCIYPSIESWHSCLWADRLYSHTQAVRERLLSVRRHGIVAAGKVGEEYRGISSSDSYCSDRVATVAVNPAFTTKRWKKEITVPDYIYDSAELRDSHQDLLDSAGTYYYVHTTPFGDFFIQGFDSLEEFLAASADTLQEHWLRQLLYDLRGIGLLKIARERMDHAFISPLENYEMRRINNVIFLLEFEAVQGQRMRGDVPGVGMTYDAGQIDLSGPVTQEAIKYILVPEHLAAIVRQVGFKAEVIEVPVITYIGPACVYKGERIPDYEGALKQILKRDNAALLAHIMRLSTPREAFRERPISLAQRRLTAATEAQTLEESEKDKIVTP
jgi:AcrR family transcriptional regulator